MPLDATVAGAAADSYLTVAAADAFAESDFGPNAEKWRTATTEDKEGALRRATRDIDVTIGRVIAAYSSEQALLFPRSVDLIAGTSDPMLPPRIKLATYLQASYLLRNAKVLDDAASFRARGLANFSNPDGTGGQVAERGFGRLHPDVEVITSEFSEGSVVGTIVLS